MMKYKSPEADQRLAYRKVFELALLVSLFLHLLVFRAFPEFSLDPGERKQVDIKIHVEEIPPTEQVKQSAPPPRPSVPIPTESEDVPDDLTIEVTSLDLSDLPEPPPLLDEDDGWENYSFIPHDEPPQPVGGFAAIQRNLKYPELARKAGVEARLVVGVLIDENGKPIKTQILHDSGSNIGFEDAAREAIMKVKWRPAKQRDAAVKVWVAIPINFVLNNKAGA